MPAQKQALLQMVFERQLERIKRNGDRKLPPTCFIAYAWGTTEEPEDWIKPKQSIKSARRWIQSHLLKALDMAGVIAYFDCRELQGGNKNLAATTDYVLLLCTPLVKRKYDDWLKKKSANGIGKEIAIINTRFIDDKVLPLICEGEPRHVNPIPMTHNSRSYDFCKPENFHEMCLRLCAKLCDLVPKEYTEEYNKGAEKIKAKQTISQEEEEGIKKWNEEGEIKLQYFWKPRLGKKGH